MKKLFKPNTNKSFKHSCPNCDPIPIDFTPTKQPVGCVVELRDGTEYRVHPTGAWVKISERLEQ